MAVFAKKSPQIIHWLALRRLAFRFDGKVKIICLSGFILPGLPAIDNPNLLVISVLIGLVVLAVAPVLLGKCVAKEIKERFGDEVLDRSLQHCSFGRYMGNKTFTIGEIQAKLEQERQAKASKSSNND